MLFWRIELARGDQSKVAVKKQMSMTFPNTEVAATPKVIANESVSEYELSQALRDNWSVSTASIWKWVPMTAQMWKSWWLWPARECNQKKNIIPTKELGYLTTDLSKTLLFWGNLTKVVKATRGQTFGEMRSKEKTSPESKEEVIKMKRDGFIPVATFSVAEKEL